MALWLKAIMYFDVVISDIIGFNYLGEHIVQLFQCDWWDVSNARMGVHTNEFFINVNTSQIWYEDDPFMLASQANQIFYLEDPKFGEAQRVVQKFVPHNIYDNILEVEKNENFDVTSNTKADQENEPESHYLYITWFHFRDIQPKLLMYQMQK